MSQKYLPPKERKKEGGEVGRRGDRMESPDNSERGKKTCVAILALPPAV